MYVATANLKRKPRLSKFESYKAANSTSKLVLKKCSFASSFVFVSTRIFMWTLCGICSWHLSLNKFLRTITDFQFSPTLVPGTRYSKSGAGVVVTGSPCKELAMHLH